MLSFCDIAAPGHSVVAGIHCHSVPRAQATERGQNLCGAGGWWHSGTMACRRFPWFQLLALLVVFLSHYMENSSHPAGHRDTSALLDEILEQWDVGAGTTPSGYIELPSWCYRVIELLLTGVIISWWLNKRLQRLRREVRERGK